MMKTNKVIIVIVIVIIIGSSSLTVTIPSAKIIGTQVAIIADCHIETFPIIAFINCTEIMIIAIYISVSARPSIATINCTQIIIVTGNGGNAYSDF
jgi:hypothetical protein